MENLLIEVDQTQKQEDKEGQKKYCLLYHLWTAPGIPDSEKGEAGFPGISEMHGKYVTS